MKNILYHYYINYQNNRLSLKKELCISYENQRYFKFIDNNGSHCVYMSDIGQVLHGKTIYLLERNDELALSLFNLYIANKISNLTKDLEKFNQLNSLA